MVVDPEQYADLPGGLKLFRDALDMLNKLSDADFQAFRSLKKWVGPLHMPCVYGRALAVVVCGGTSSYGPRTPK